MTSKNCLKFVVVGEGTTGKTSFIMTLSNGSFPQYLHDQRSIPIIDSMEFKTIHKETQIKIELFDTAGQDDYDKIRPLIYPNTDVFLVCYSTMFPFSFERISTKWIPEIRQKSETLSPKIILIGTKIDLREEGKSVEKLKQKKETPITTEMGNQLKMEMNVDGFCEISSLNNFGVNEVINLAMEILFESKNEGSKKCELM
jgi:small GTP-binding protein